MTYPPDFREDRCDLCGVSPSQIIDEISEEEDARPKSAADAGKIADKLAMRVRILVENTCGKSPSGFDPSYDMYIENRRKADEEVANLIASALQSERQEALEEAAELAYRLSDNDGIIRDAIIALKAGARDE